MKQAWGKLQGSRFYEAKTLQELCHVQAQPSMHLHSEEKEQIRRRLMEAAPHSALALHFGGRLQQQSGTAAISMDVTADERTLFRHMDCERIGAYSDMLFHEVIFSSSTHCKIRKFEQGDLTEAEQQFYAANVAVTAAQAAQICADTRSQESTKWQRVRKIRITGSICHAYYTFVPRDDRTWDQKVSAMLGYSFRGNAATRYGKESEDHALKEYTDRTGNAVVRLGVVVNPLVPWLGYSPDGISFRDGRPPILLEVKSPVLGKSQKAAELARAKKLPYVKQDGENFVLNRRHSYFSQVQLGMFLLNLDVTHFVIYSKVKSLILTVHRCNTHIDQLVTKLQFVYFQHVLPELAKRAQLE